MRPALIILFLLATGTLFGQSADNIFHASAGLYIHSKTAEAKKMLDDGIRKYPNDPKLNALRSKIKEEEKKENEQKENNEDQEKQDEKQKEQEKQDKEQKDKDQKNKEDQEKQDQEKEKKEKEQKQDQQKPEEKKDEKKEPQPSSEKMKQMKISEEKAKMVLEAMKNQEVQYLQQNKRKATKPKDKGKPDW